MVRLNLELPDSLSRSLAERAEREGQSLNEFVLHSLERILNEATEDPLLQALGTLESDTPDLGQRHDDYLAQALHDKRE
jgi:hypothetical protein